jgi:glutathione S-transferase
MRPGMPLTLYYHPLSSYCHKVLIALYENGNKFDPQIVNLGDPQERAQLQARWPFGKFPVIHDDERDRNVAESSIIIEYLDCFYRGGQAMIPAEANDALQVRHWDRFFDLYVHNSMQDIVADRIGGSKGDMAPRRATLETAYSMINEHMRDRIWAGSEQFSMADCAAAPALFYASVLQPFHQDAGHLKAYFERLIARPSYAQVLWELRPYLQYFPFVELVPDRFR